MTNPIEDFRHADTIFVLGSNTTEQHPLIAERIIDAKLHHDATLIVADPRCTALAAMADIHLGLQPGTDTLLINTLCKIILDEGLYNQTFIDERTENFLAFRTAMEKGSLADSVKRIGVNEEHIRQAARLYARGPNSSIAFCMGITQHATGTSNCLALCNLSMLCGMVGRPHTGVNPLRGQSNVQGSCDMGALPEVLTNYLSVKSPEALERFSPVWGKDFSRKIGLPMTEIVDAAVHGHIRGLFVVGENPVVSDPHSAHVLQGLQNIPFIVVQDIFMTETAKLAHLILPAASWLEKDGTFTNTERLVQRIYPVCQPLEGTKPDWEISTLLLRAMGHHAPYSSAEDIFNEMCTVTPSYKGMTYSRLEKEKGLCWPCPEEGHSGTPILHEKTFTRGKGLFSALEFTCDFEETDEEYPFTLTTGRVGFHYHTGTMTRRVWFLDREYPENFIQIHPNDAKSLGLWENQRIRLRSRQGVAHGLVRITQGMREGVLFMPFHFAEEAANNLTGNKTDPIAKIPSFKVTAVTIEKP